MTPIATSQSPVGSVVFSLVALLAISIVVLLILRHYLPLRTTPAFLLVPVFFALWLPASIVLLVPIDLASSAMVDDIDARGIWLEPKALRVSWRITYWLTFALTWCALPALQSLPLFFADMVHGPRPGSFCPFSPSSPTPATASPRTSSATPSAPTPSTTPSSLAPAPWASSMSCGPTASRPTCSRAPSWRWPTAGVWSWSSILWGTV